MVIGDVRTTRTYSRRPLTRAVRALVPTLAVAAFLTGAFGAFAFAVLALAAAVVPVIAYQKPKEVNTRD